MQKLGLHLLSTARLIQLHYLLEHHSGLLPRIGSCILREQYSDIPKQEVPGRFFLPYIEYPQYERR